MAQVIRRRASTPDTIERMSQIRDRRLRQELAAIDVSALAADISTLQTDLGTAEGNITNLQTDLGTAQGDITTLQSDVADRLEFLFGNTNGTGVSGTTAETTIVSQALASAHFNTARKQTQLRAWGTVTFTGTQTLALRAYWDFAGGGATQIGTSGTMSGAAGTYWWQLEVIIGVYTTGPTGTIAGHAHATAQRNATARSYRTGTDPTVTKDLTGSCTLSITAQVNSTAASVVTQGWQIIDLN